MDKVIKEITTNDMQIGNIVVGKKDQPKLMKAMENGLDVYPITNPDTGLKEYYMRYENQFIRVFRSWFEANTFKNENGLNEMSSFDIVKDEDGEKETMYLAYATKGLN